MAESLYDALLRLLARLPEVDKPIEVPGVWAGKIEPSRSSLVATLLTLRGTRPLSDFVDLIPLMDAWTRERFASAAGALDMLADDVHDALLAMVGDRSPRVRADAVDALRKARLVPAEAPGLEKLLTRKAGDLRRGVLSLLATLPTADVLTCARRLSAGTEAQRDAACELVGLVPSDSAVVALASELGEGSATQHQLELLAKVTAAEAASEVDGPGLGLFDASRRTPSVRPPRPDRDRPFSSDVARRIVGALDDLAEANRDTPFLLTTWQGSREVLLADARFLPGPFGGPAGVVLDDEGAGGMVLSEVFRPWWRRARRRSPRGRARRPPRIRRVVGRSRHVGASSVRPP